MPQSLLRTVIIFSFLGFVFANSGLYLERPVGCIKFSEAPLCSGQGKCVLYNSTSNMDIVIHEGNVPGSRCVCNSGWTGVGDLVDMAEHDCSQNIYAIYVMWSIILACALSCFFVSIFRIRKLSIPWRKENEGKKFKLKVISFLQADQFRPACMGIILGVAWTVLATMRIYYKGTYGAIGQTGLATFLFWIGVSMFLIINHTKVYSFLAISMKLVHFKGEQRERLQKIFKRLGRGLIVNYIIMQVGLCSVFVLVGRPEDSNLILFVYYQYFGVTTIILCSISSSAITSFINLLTDGIENLPEAQRHARSGVAVMLRKIMRQSIVQTFQASAPYFLVAFWPFLRAKVSYLLVLSMPNICLFITFLVYKLKPPKPKKPGEDTRSSESNDSASPRKSSLQRPSLQTKNLSPSNGVSPIRPSQFSNGPGSPSVPSTGRRTLAPHPETPPPPLEAVNLLEVRRFPSDPKSKPEDTGPDVRVSLSGQKIVEEMAPGDTPKLNSSGSLSESMIKVNVVGITEQEILTPDDFGTRRNSLRAPSGVWREKSLGLDEPMNVV